MTNLLFGILTIIFCLIGYFYSWKYQSKENFTVAILLLVLCGLALRIYASADFYLHPWDERYHALVAKHLIRHPLIPTLYDNPVLPYNIMDWTANHIWLHKQPLPLWAMAASMWLFGINEIALRLPSIISSTIGIYITYYIGSYFFNKRIGYLAALLYSISGVIIEMTSGRIATDHIDVFFLCLIELAVFFTIVFVKRKNTVYNILAGVCIGAAILTKWLPALIVVPVWLLIVIDSKKFKTGAIVLQLILLLSVTCIVFLPWQVYIFKTFPLEAVWELGNNYRHITEVQAQQGGPFYYYIQRIGINYGELIYIPLIWFLWKSLKNLTDLKRTAICLWFLVPIIFFSFVKTKMEGYILFTSPALFIISAEFWFMLVKYQSIPKLKWLKLIVLFLLIALPVRYCIERLKVFNPRDRNPQWVIDLKNMGKTDNYKNGVLFNYNHPIEAMFYTNLTVYPNIPDKATIDSLMHNGYTVIVNDDGIVSKDIISINGIIVKHLK